MSLKHTLFDALLRAGHATLDAPEVLGPVTVGGWYPAKNGFRYQCRWIAGRLQCSPRGYSAELLAALDSWEAEHGPAFGFEAEEAWERYALTRFGKPVAT